MINVEQAYAAFRTAQAERRMRFHGSMTWKTVGGHVYLYKKSAGQWKSLGPRNPDTELIIERFRSGRTAVKERIAALDAAIRRMAPVNKAMRLGRVPWLPARLLRKLESRQLLGHAMSVVGTHALYAYERMAGGHFDSSQVATQDIDFLFDARSQLRLAARGTGEEGLQGLLRSVDHSFEPVTPGGYRVVNNAGFMVDLIRPMPKSPTLGGGRSRVGNAPTDMTAAEIEGLAWLQNCPQIHQTAVDERGYPVRLAVPDPRAFALHKLWVSERPDRDRMKARRDLGQASAIAGLVQRYLPHLRFDDEALGALPAILRDRVPELLERARLDAIRAEEW